MTKSEFILLLQEKLSGATPEETAERIEFYREMIEDGIEDGLSEEEAVARIGSVDNLNLNLPNDRSLSSLEKKCLKKSRSTGEILLLILGSPIWISLLAAGLAVLVSVCFALWAVMIALWASFAAVAGCGVGGVVGGIVLTIFKGPSGIALFAGGLICCGLSVFLYMGCRLITKWMYALTRRMILWIKKTFSKKETRV